MVYFVKSTQPSNFIHFSVQIKMTLISASYLSPVLHTRDTEINEEEVILVPMQYRLMGNTGIKRDRTSVVRIKKRLSVGFHGYTGVILRFSLNLTFPISLSFSCVFNFLSNQIFQSQSICSNAFD